MKCQNKALFVFRPMQMFTNPLLTQKIASDKRRQITNVPQQPSAPKMAHTPPQMPKFQSSTSLEELQQHIAENEFFYHTYYENANPYPLHTGRKYRNIQKIQNIIRENDQGSKHTHNDTIRICVVHTAFCKRKY